jgi:predicted DNA-binding antitoxin AbrB/MazE fold protein
MSLTIPAVYEKGVFHPIRPLPELPDGAKVLLTVQDGKSSEKTAATRSLTDEEFYELIRSKNPHAEEIPEELWKELKRAHQIAMSNVRDPEVMRQTAERMDRLAQQIYEREGLLDIDVPYIREIRDEE